METHHHPVFASLPQPAGVVACSICLSVLRGSAWVEAEEAIRELRSFESREPVRLAPGLCDDCADARADRRAGQQVSAAAA